MINETRNIWNERVQDSTFSDNIWDSPTMDVLSNPKKYNQQTIDIKEHSNWYEIKLLWLKNGNSIFKIWDKKLKLEHPSPLQIFSDKEWNAKEIYWTLIEEVTWNDNKIIFKWQTAEYRETSAFWEDTIIKYNWTPEEIISQIRWEKHQKKENNLELKQVKAITGNIETNKNILNEISNIESKSLGQINVSLYDIINQWNNLDKISLIQSDIKLIDLSKINNGIITLNPWAKIKINWETYYVNQWDNINLSINLDNWKIQDISWIVELNWNKYNNQSNSFLPDFIKKSDLSLKDWKIIIY